MPLGSSRIWQQNKLGSGGSQLASSLSKHGTHLATGNYAKAWQRQQTLNFKSVSSAADQVLVLDMADLNGYFISFFAYLNSCCIDVHMFRCIDVHICLWVRISLVAEIILKGLFSKRPCHPKIIWLRGRSKPQTLSCHGTDGHIYNTFTLCEYVMLT